MKELVIKNVNKFFGKHHVLKDVSKVFPPGKFYCLLGPSGCGKTTILRIIAGLESCEQGQVIYDDQDITRLPPEKRHFGMVFQSYALFPNLTIEKNIAYGLTTSPAEKEKRVGELLELIGLSGSEKKYPSQLSGGQQQRISLARSLATDPAILLLDEPLSALDAKVRVSLRRQIKALQRKLGITMIMVTHDQEEAMSLGDEIILLNDGIIEQEGDAESIYKQPANLFCSGFIGIMNYIPFRVNAEKQLALNDSSGFFTGPEISSSQEYLLGVRPEDILINPPADDPRKLLYLDGELVDIEYLGGFRLMQLRLEMLPNKPILAYAPASIHHDSNNQAVPIAIQTEKVSVFNKKTNLPLDVTYHTGV